MDLDKGANLCLDSKLVPPELHNLIPFVAKWGIQSQEDQDLFVEKMLSERPDEVVEFNRAMDTSDRAFRQWSALLTEFDKNASEFTNDDWEHPYWAFLAACKIRELTGPSTDPVQNAMNEDVVRQVHIERRRIRFCEVISEADEAFRNKEYESFVSLLTPYEDLLTSTQKKKLALAMRRSELKRTGG